MEGEKEITYSEAKNVSLEEREGKLIKIKTIEDVKEWIMDIREQYFILKGTALLSGNLNLHLYQEGGLDVVVELDDFIEKGRWATNPIKKMQNKVLERQREIDKIY